MMGSELRFGPDGAERFCGAASGDLAQLSKWLSGYPPERPGVRLYGIPGFGDWLELGPIERLVAALAGGELRPVRALLFDKTAATNWALGWHQDATIAVRERKDVPGFGAWTIKGGRPHVEPPFSLLQEMVTVRVHIDPVSPLNAPLLIAPGSHRLGWVRKVDMSAVVGRCGVRACLAEAGDVWVYSTPILHASKRSAEPIRRRVLQVDYAPDTLPPPLRWLGI